MTNEERCRWERRRQDAKEKLAEIAPVRAELKRLSQSYDQIFCRNYMKFAEADERLAMEDGRFKKVATAHPKGARSIKEYTPEELLRLMSKEQLLKLQGMIKGGSNS